MGQVALVLLVAEGQDLDVGPPVVDGLLTEPGLEVGVLELQVHARRGPAAGVADRQPLVVDFLVVQLGHRLQSLEGVQLVLRRLEHHLQGVGQRETVEGELGVELGGG